MSSFTLKIIALILMVIDHIGLYFEGAPFWFRLLGRLSYPLFLFCMVWSYHYTKDRKKYLLRLYLLSVFMTFSRYEIDSIFPTEYGYGNHNIFLSMFIVGFLISSIEAFIQNRKKGYLMIGAIALTQVIYHIIPSLLPFTKSLSGDYITGLIPNLSLNEYGFEFIILGVLMYFLRENKPAFTIMYLIFSIWQFSSEMLEYGMAYQWLMVFSLPLMLKYNHQKGKSMKYFFYLFYPAHSFLLFYLANFVIGK